ncbi:hypothetical protein J3P96_10920 [Pseudomonas sp. R3-56]|uniref:hypothetical protein n=1 Tax=unclassified Pseudomonas TaxID=196821 RepID=UPI003DA80DF9
MNQILAEAVRLGFFICGDCRLREQARSHMNLCMDELDRDDEVSFVANIPPMMAF